MKTYFIRHTRNLDATDDVIATFSAEARIAIHWEDKASFEPTDYSGQARGAFEVFQDLSRNGGYVCATYHGVPGCILGRIRPGTRRTIENYRWRDNPHKTLVLKLLQLDPRTVLRIDDPGQAAAVLVGRPQQQTIATFSRASDLIRTLVEREHVRPSVSRLTPFQQEVMCSEFLRLVDSGLPVLKQLLFPVGRTLEDVDIIGVSGDNKLLFAQVTASNLPDCKKIDKKTGRGKFHDLCKYRGDGNRQLVLFCDCQREEAGFNDGVHIVPIAMVFQRFLSEAPLRRWLRFAFRQTFGERMDLSALEEHDTAVAG